MKHVCKICGLETEDSTKFPFSYNTRKDGTKVRSYKKRCYRCTRRIYQGLDVKAREKYSEKRDLVREAKNKPCADCGMEYPYYVMQFDHIRDKKFNLAEFVRHTLQEVKEEIEKCEVVCANCHCKRTHERRMKKGLE